MNMQFISCDWFFQSCKHIKVEIIKGNHFTMLLADKLADCINNNIIVPKTYD